MDLKMSTSKFCGFPSGSGSLWYAEWVMWVLSQWKHPRTSLFFWLKMVHPNFANYIKVFSHWNWLFWCILHFVGPISWTTTTGTTAAKLHLCSDCHQRKRTEALTPAVWFHQAVFLGSGGWFFSRLAHQPWWFVWIWPCGGSSRKGLALERINNWQWALEFQVSV